MTAPAANPVLTKTQAARALKPRLWSAWAPSIGEFDGKGGDQRTGRKRQQTGQRAFREGNVESDRSADHGRSRCHQTEQRRHADLIEGDHPVFQNSAVDAARYRVVTLGPN